MLTLDEAVAKVKEEFGIDPACCAVCRADYNELMAAVRNVALATEQLGQDGFRHSEIVAKIIRLLGSATSK